MASPEKKLWIENYRPRKMSEIILPSRLKNQFEAMVKEGEIPNLLLAGNAGAGKTTIARVLANELNCDFYMINGSEESGIDVLRTKVKSFAATMSVMSESKHKIMCIDEADYLNASSTQPALRGLMEEYWQNCRFIFTCNNKSRIINPLHSRCTVIDFSFSKEEKQAMMAAFFKRALAILNENNVKVDQRALATYIQSMFPDFRRILNELQRYATCGEIDSGILKMTGDEAISEIITFLKSKNFREMRSWVDMNPEIEVASLFEKLYSQLPDVLMPESVPELILVLDEYQTKALSALNAKINIAACLTQLMATIHFKN